VGDNSGSAWLTHPQHGGPVGVDFRVVTTYGVGNEKVEMRYELIPHLASVDDHLYTHSVQERDNAVNMLYYRSGAIACYVFDNPQQNTVPLFRLSNSSVPDHLYTPDVQERANSGLADEGVACYIHNAQQPGTTPLYRLFNPGRSSHLYTANVEERIIPPSIIEPRCIDHNLRVDSSPTSCISQSIVSSIFLAVHYLNLTSPAI
jgi:Repeat of unknown function (DUF5648)